MATGTVFMGRLLVVLGTIAGWSRSSFGSRYGAHVVALGICKKRSHSNQP
ncbi:MAG: hypothetical protein ABI833_05300 [Acidobacteriota bacterium]